MVGRAFRILVAMAVALPLGQGGLCCCLFEGPGADTAVAVAPAAEHSCCDADAPSAPARPERERSGEDGCGCPTREAAVLASAGADAVGALTAPSAGAEVVPVERPLLPVVAPATREATEAPAPIPKTPLYRTHCALLC